MFGGCGDDISTLNTHRVSQRQAAIADCLKIIKADLVDDDRLAVLTERLTEINPAADQLGVRHGEVYAERLIAKRLPGSDNADLQARFCTKSRLVDSGVCKLRIPSHKSYGPTSHIASQYDGTLSAN